MGYEGCTPGYWKNHQDNWEETNPSVLFGALYQDARALVRSLRETEAQETGDQYRMVFAKHQAEAEKLLSTPRDERVIGED